jgi:hypothetical protein
MGLRFSHCKASWSCTGFNSFRRRLANEIGFDLDLWWTLGALEGDRTTYRDPIELLLDHSDCDGELPPEECKVIAPRLRELIKDWPDGIFAGGYDKEMALLLAEGMERAAEAGEALDFH